MEVFKITFANSLRGGVKAEDSIQLAQSMKKPDPVKVRVTLPNGKEVEFKAFIHSIQEAI